MILQAALLVQKLTYLLADTRPAWPMLRALHASLRQCMLHALEDRCGASCGAHQAEVAQQPGHETASVDEALSILMTGETAASEVVGSLYGTSTDDLPASMVLMNAIACACHCDGSCTEHDAAVKVRKVLPYAPFQARAFGGNGAAEQRLCERLLRMATTVCSRGHAGTAPCHCRQQLLLTLMGSVSCMTFLLLDHADADQRRIEQQCADCNTRAHRRLLTPAAMPGGEPLMSDGRRIVVVARLNADEVSFASVLGAIDLHSETGSPDEGGVIMMSFGDQEIKLATLHFGIIKRSNEALCAFALAARAWCDRSDNERLRDSAGMWVSAGRVRDYTGAARVGIDLRFVGPDDWVALGCDRNDLSNRLYFATCIVHRSAGGESQHAEVAQ